MSVYRLIKLVALLGLLGRPAPAFCGEKLEGGGLALARSAVSSGGEKSSAGGFKLQSALGEAVFSPSAAGAFKASAGYIPLSAQPGTVVSIAAVTKSTGTLRLAWTAPGADGAQGAVVNGVYRVDYSSSPSHQFRPSVFRTEFSTSVAPGTAQALSIGGLEPNTTYYAKIYLGDATRFMAEDSSYSRESTLANIPVNPYFSAVTVDSVTISWLLPAGGAEGYDAEGSSTNFSGGDLAAGMTPQGLELSMTVGGWRRAPPIISRSPAATGRATRTTRRSSPP